MTVINLPSRHKRPAPPPLDLNGAFYPSSELADWLRAVFIAPGGPLQNERYDHLQYADIACLWTWVPNSRNMRGIAAQAELMPPMAMGKWQRARAEYQIELWFGAMPDFLITFDAGFASMVDDATFCSLVEHELHHCGQERDAYGAPKFTQDGKPKFAIQGHDVEEFVGVVERYGATATHLEAMKAALNAKPAIGQASIAAACGTCQHRKRA